MERRLFPHDLRGVASRHAYFWLANASNHVKLKEEEKTDICGDRGRRDGIRIDLKKKGMVFLK